MKFKNSLCIQFPSYSVCLCVCVLLISVHADVTNVGLCQMGLIG